MRSFCSRLTYMVGSTFEGGHCILPDFVMSEKQKQENLEHKPIQVTVELETTFQP